MSNHHPRPLLARQYADSLQGKTGFSGASDGLFVAGERRTGKSSFLRFDLCPELERRGLLALYVDLLEEKAQTPGAALAATLTKEMQKHPGIVTKVVTALGVNKVGIPGVAQFDLRTSGQADGLTLAQGLELLHQQTKKPVVLMVDEAQHALTTKEGDDAMWALKSARDQMKTPTGANLMLVMSGSHSDKLSLLLNSPKAPFWGSEVGQLPLLGDDFADARMADLRQAFPALARVRGSAGRSAFEHVGRRPPFFDSVIRRALQAMGSDGDAGRFEAALLDAAKGTAAQDQQRFTDTFLTLSALEQAVLERVITQGRNFRAFDAPALAFYTQRLGKETTAASVQNALDALRMNDEQLVWKSGRGDYSVYDQGLTKWHALLVAEGTWPPAP